MSSFVSHTDPGLIAILLVIQARSSSGPQLLFHYPPNPQSESGPPIISSRPDHDHDTSSNDSSDDLSADEEDSVTTKGVSRSRDPNWRGLGSRAVLTDEDDEADGENARTSPLEKPWRPSWEPLLGLGSVGLASLLAPGRLWHKKRFELGINHLAFLGWPVHTREDGSWKRKKKKRTTSSGLHGAERKLEEAAETDAAANGTDSEDYPAAGEGHISASTQKPEKESKTDQGRSDLTMFNVVFVLDPPVLEYNICVKEMYTNVVKRLARALRRVQIHSNYMRHETEVIQSVGARHLAQKSSSDVLYAELLSTSTLASAIATVYKSISSARIASMELAEARPLSLQIPPITSTSILPSLVDEPIPPGLWLTTANDHASSTSDVDTSPGALQLFRHFTLLLQDSPQKMIKDVQAAGGQLALPLSTFIAAVNPAKSFHKISMASHISLSDIQVLAHHLIYWRRATAIPPLHQRDTYILSPNADMSKLRAACKAYETIFPTLPGLEKILAALGDTPRPWGTRIPSTDHREAYYQVLGWLMRGGWVTQLRTFGYVRVDPEVKTAVREKEKLEKQKKVQDTMPLTEEEEEREHGNISSLSSSLKRPSIVSHPSSDGRQTLSDLNFKHDPTTASLILDPQRASPLESKWLEHIAETLLTTNYSSHELSEEERAELRKYWLQWVKYFNGSEPLEKIPVREGLKRKFVWDLLGKMGLNFDTGMEDEVQSRPGRILVTVRHW